MKKIIIIIPCFNEEENVGNTSAILEKTFKDLIKKNKISRSSLILFVDDGSEDETWKKILVASRKNKFIKGIRFSKNFGHQQALSAGIKFADKKCDACITLDADLQQDPKVIEVFLDEFEKGYDVVYGVRKNRDNDNFLKRMMANYFYFLMKLFKVEMIKGHADYRLISQRAVNYILQFTESNPFYRAIIPSIGLPYSIVKFEVNKRVIGRTKYTFFKMLKLGIGGLTSFSIIPIRLIAFTGFLILIISLILLGYILWIKFFTADAIPGWASTLIPIYAFSGVQMMSIGILGEYIGRIFIEVKKRPHYIILDKTDKSF